MPFINSKSLVRYVKDRSNSITAYGFLQLGRVNMDLLIVAVRNHANLKLGHLSDFFFQRHALEQTLNPLRVVAFRSCDADRVLVKLIAIGDVCGNRSSLVSR